MYLIRHEFTSLGKKYPYTKAGMKAAAKARKKTKKKKKK